MAAKKTWTSERKSDLIDYLSSPRTTYKSAAKKFETTEKAVLSILDKMGMRSIPRIRGWISALELVSYMGYDKNAVYRLEKANYPFYIHYGGRYTTIDDFWKFMKNNKDFFDLRKLERGVLIPEPKWLDEHLMTTTRHCRKEWSSSEVALLKHMYYNECKNCVQIAQQLDRTPRSVRAKIARIAKKQMNKTEESLV